MSQDQWIILLLKIATICGFVSLTGWIVVYSMLAAWWRNPIGRTLVAKSALIAALLVPFIMSLFFQLNRLDSRIAAWVDVALIGAITPVMAWRTVMWLRVSREDRTRADETRPGSCPGTKGGAP